MIAKGIGLNSTDTHKFRAWKDGSQVYNGTAWEEWVDGNAATYLLTANRVGTTDRYTGTVPDDTDFYELLPPTGGPVWTHEVNAAGSSSEVEQNVEVTEQNVEVTDA